MPSAHLPELSLRELPEKLGSFWKLAGPGAILVGLSIGAGELAIWPRIVAQYGASMVWAAVFGLIVQVWINFEVGRWTLATGESIYTGFCRVWKGFAPIFILLNVLGWLAPGWGRASGLALKALLVGPSGYGSDTFWTCVTFGLVALLLFGPKAAYKSVELTIEGLVIIITVGLLVVAFTVGSAQDWKDLGHGIINIPHREPGFLVKDLFIALVFAGAGGTANLFYSFYVRDKGLGMGVHVPQLQNPLRGETERVPSTGFRFEDTEDNRRKFRDWFRHIVKDQVLFFWGLNTFTILLFIYGALAVLHRQGIVPEPGRLVYDQAVILSDLMGPAGRYLFLMVGVATLFSTQVTLVDGVSRSISDIIYVNYPKARGKSLGWWYMLIAAAWMVAGCGITAVMEHNGVSELGFLFNAAYMGGFAMAIYSPLLLFINLRYLPRSARPGPLNIVCMCGACLLYGGFAIACIYWEITSRMG